jgi:hypothetical protein
MLAAFHGSAYTVTQLSAFWRDGQVFLTWQDPGAVNLKYHVYRSTSAITSASDLASSFYVGYVRDHSAQNIRKSQLQNGTYFFVIDPASGPLQSGTGLYVTTSTDNLPWYYAVTVEVIATGEEDQQINPGENSLTAPVEETVAAPQPVLQQSTVNGNVTAMEYVIWGNNTNGSLMPAFNNCGSYGYLFTFFLLGNDAAPLYIYFRNTDPFTQLQSDFASGRHVLIMDDWLPNGKNTNWVGYHEDYDIYSVNNSQWTTGTVKTNTQTRMKYIMNWTLTHLPILQDQVYSSGSSHNGLGAALTAQLNPELFAAVWTSVTPILFKAVDGTDWEEIWCASNKNLETDVTDPATGEPIRIFDLLDLRHMYDANYSSGIPYIAGIHGKQDYTVGWVEAKHWYDSVNYSHQGGLWFWDQREHDGDGKQFDDEEIKIDFSRFSTQRAYPAFSHCSINQDPGNGSRNSGDPYGAINGFLDWDDSKTVDNECLISMKCIIKDMTVGGVLQEQYDSCFTDITFRRVQHFQPQAGDKLVWWVKSSGNVVIQQGQMIYDGNPITLTGIKVLRNGSWVRVKLKGCEENEEGERSEGESLVQGEPDALLLAEEEVQTPAFNHSYRNARQEHENDYAETVDRAFSGTGDQQELEYPLVSFYRSGSGYVVETKLAKAMDVLVQMTDMTGRIHIFRRLHMVDGSNEFNLDAYRGNYLLTLYSPEFTYKKKISF